MSIVSGSEFLTMETAGDVVSGERASGPGGGVLLVPMGIMVASLGWIGTNCLSFGLESMSVRLILGVSVGIILCSVWFTCDYHPRTVARLGSSAGEELSLIVLTALAVFVTCWPARAWYSAVFPDMAHINRAVSLSSSCVGEIQSAFINSWTIWADVVHRFGSEVFRLYPLLTMSLCLSALVVFLRHFRDRRFALMVLALSCWLTPLVIAAKLPFPAVFGGFLFWTSLLLLHRLRTWDERWSGILAALLFREAMFLFVPLFFMVFFLPVLLRGSIGEGDQDRRGDSGWFIYPVIVLTGERLFWLWISDARWGVNHELFPPAWIPSTGSPSLIIVSLMGLAIVSVLVHYWWRRPGGNVVPGIVLVFGAMVGSLFILEVSLVPTDRVMVLTNFLSLFPTGLLFMIAGWTGILIFSVSDGRVITRWLFTIILVHLGFLAWLRPENDLIRVAILTPILVPLLLVGCAELITANTGKRSQSVLHWVIVLMTIVAFRQSLPPDLSVPWDAWSRDTAFRVVDAIPSGAHVLLDCEDPVSLTAVLFRHSGSWSYTANSGVEKLIDDFPGRVVYALNMPEEVIYSFGYHHVVRRSFGRWYEHPDPCYLSATWTPHDMLLEEIVPAENLFRRSEGNDLEPWTLDFGFNDRGLVSNFHKRGRFGSELIFRWTTMRSEFKIPTLKLNRYTLTFFPVQSLFPRSRTMKLDVWGPGSVFLGSVTEKEHTITLPESLVSTPLTHIVLTSRTFRPSKKPGGDTRYLGVALEKVSVMPDKNSQPVNKSGFDVK